MGSNISKGSVAVVPVEVLPAEIIHDIKVGPSVLVVIAPRAAETVARVVLIEARFRGNVPECSVAVVLHHEVGRTVLGIMIRNGIFVLIGALVIDVETKINV